MLGEGDLMMGEATYLQVGKNDLMMGEATYVLNGG